MITLAVLNFQRIKILNKKYVKINEKWYINKMVIDHANRK
ncbi:hypothetical protein MPTP_0521 [Melissococcus plutonius ATCC 35311]|uniref:Uncharacterized protein n=2 Tax=Melissococcus plutonius TaxID=33970 RepID=F3Y918_MELPT|nr:hypothetical protein MPTP_0521 [Melissococcus plutonius ATCC 35311]BAL62603.1 hypothetical protein MPD5_1396 [Melissococcus plutonius DAT561]BBC61487.1 hypothetical protein DAT561_1388 [Melissococcus plutonius]BBD14842.1 hypothetical protein DAT585_0464 [Melissococcus plutonius]BBD17386.1 hypothetical protein DAT606_1474 [Melissococcus plutonius]